MDGTIRQRVKFATTPRDLYATYLNSRAHSAATGGKARIRAVVGAPFSAWDGYITGQNLLLLPGRRIVQSWRARDWSRVELGSILILDFLAVPGGAELRLEHLRVPARHTRELARGWRDYYWTPWKAYLKARG
ncbi:MAG: SRPBCC domain-containing protein [Candidatus Eisenbacteria bacterium]